MTRFAANLTMLFNDVDFLERFEKAHQAGFKAVEFLFPYAYEPKILADKLNQFGLEQVLFNMPPGDWNAGERGLAAIPGREEEFKQSVDVVLSYALALKCKKIHAMSGIINPQFSHQQHVQTFIHNIRYAADQLAQHNIELMIEPLNKRDVPNYFITHQREAVELIKQVKRTNVKLQFDLYHAQIMDGDLTMLIREVADYIGHIQIASVPERNEPVSGEVNYPYLYQVLDEVGYQGWIGCEYKPKTTTEEGLTWIKSFL